MAVPIVVLPVLDVPEVVPGSDLAELLVDATRTWAQPLTAGDVVVISSKVVSKALDLRWPTTDRGAAVAAQTRRVVAERRIPAREGTADDVSRVVESLAGPVMAAAGVDASNTGDDPRPLLLPEDPDARATDLLNGLLGHAGLTPGDLGVVISDTAGRPWRTGQIDFALGSAGLRVVDDLRGATDSDGRALAVTSRAVADEVAAAADLVKGKVAGIPAAVVRGMAEFLLDPSEIGEAGVVGMGATDLVRTGPADWFALGHVEAVRAALGVAPGSAAAAEIGLPSTEPEPVETRVGRAVKLALSVLDDRDEVAVDSGGTSVTVSGPDGYAVGLVTARLQVALASEGLMAETTVTRGVTVRTDLSIDSGSLTG